MLAPAAPPPVGAKVDVRVSETSSGPCSCCTTPSASPAAGGSPERCPTICLEVRLAAGQPQGENVPVGHARTTTTFGAGGLLERSAQLQELDEHLGAVRSQGRGQLVLIGGEAGIGKTTLVRAFCEERRSIRVLWGACDALYTPRPLGPFVDIADEAGGELAALVAEGATPGELVAALAGELGRRSPSVVVLEDLHWADEATLDVVRLLARRVESVPALVLATYRDDELDRAHPLRIVLGELPRHAADRMALAPLSAHAVAALAGSAGVDHGELHRRTAGNPFFVTEVLATADDAIPETVRDAVLARIARLDEGAQALLDIVAIVPLRAELWLLEALADGDLAQLDACLASGVLRAERDAVGFRHEIARVAVEEALSPHRRMALHRKAVAALVAHGARSDPARVAHHAEPARRRPCSDRIARRPRSSPVRCATRRAWRPNAAPSSWSAARTSATSPATSRTPSTPVVARSTSTARPATGWAKATPTAGSRA
jgi:hypothetical protein